MKKCPFCSEDILEDVVKCKYCGAWIGEKVQSSDSIQKREFKLPWLFGGIALFAFLISLFTPVILAPIVILFTGAFFILEIVFGNRPFGVIVGLLTLISVIVWINQMSGVGRAIEESNRAFENYDCARVASMKTEDMSSEDLKKQIDCIFKH